MSHIEFVDLLRTFEQPEASLSRRPDVTEHLSDCTKCSAVYQKLSDFFDHSRRVKAERVPQATTAHLLNIFRPLPKRSPEKPAAAFLVFDDWTSIVYERHSGIDTRQLLYRVGEYEVDLRLEFVEDRCLLTGQVLPDAPGARVDVVGTNGDFSSVLTELSEFDVGPLSQGIYEITISSSPSIVIKDVPLQQ